jgi:ubiquinone/menaquinone biosynthesis C-methylase UbiE
VSAIYDTIGTGYSAQRQSDPRIAARIEGALGQARTVINVGAGTGSYEPADRWVTAVEPSAEMLAQRPPGSALVVQASAEALPFPDRHFDAAMAVLTIHHWSDQARGLAEMRRVARGPVAILT